VNGSELPQRIVLRPIASPAALGFLGLAGATLTVAALQLEWIDAAEGSKVALILIGFTVPLQAVASVFGFLGRDGVIATGMGILSGTWLAIGLVFHTLRPGETSDALGVFLLAAGTAMLVPALSALYSKLVPALVLGTAGVRFFLGGIHELTGNTAWANAAGVVGLFLFAFAVYAALAAELEDVSKLPILPLGRRGRARDTSQPPGVREAL
jgi:succinate-acetate transporter protein